MAVQKLTPRYLNKDDDARLVKPTEMTDAQNVRISFDDDGDGLVIKNAYGNTEITLETSLPSGTNKVIGSVSNEIKGFIYYFVFNRNPNPALAGAHSIYRYSIGTNKSTQVYLDSTTPANNILNFGENSFVEGNVVNDIKGNELLYFNDSINSPKKINVTKAITGRYPDKFTTGTTEEKSLYFTVAKQPPLEAPTFNILNNPAVQENRIRDKVFQFAYRYIYEDGEISSLSAYSSLAVSVNQLRRGFTNEGQDNFFNQINVFVKNTEADVDKIQVFAREGNEGAFFQIDERDNVNGTSTATVRFTNNVAGDVLSDQDKNKLFDNVPHKADSQEIASGRLMYGGYTEGYPNTGISASLLPNYKDTEDIFNIGFTHRTNASLNSQLTLSLPSDFPTSFTKDTVVILNVVLGGDSVELGDSASGIDLVDTKIGVRKIEDNTFEEFNITQTADLVNCLTSGIRIFKQVNISASSSFPVTRAQVLNELRTAVYSSDYEMSLEPINGQSVVLKASGTPFTAETGRLKGKAIVTPVTNGPASNTFYEFSLSRVEFTLDSFIKGGNAYEIINNALLVADISVSSSYMAFTNANAGGIIVVSDNRDSSGKAFKSGSEHKLGVVYYDDRNRSSGVQEVGDVFVNSLNDRSTENDNYGPASIVLRVSGLAPSWAKRWAPVYVGKGTSELKLQYSIDGAFLPFRENTPTQNQIPRNSIYLSLNSLFRKDSGYNDSTGANISYGFTKGDRLRILYYGDDLRETQEFKVLAFQTLGDDQNNPILNRSSKRMIQETTGDFLVVEENESATDFTVKKLRDSTSSSPSGWQNKCVIEIYNVSEVRKELYFEVGKSYSINTSTRAHEGERTSTSVAADVTTGTATGVVFTTSVQVFKGDILTNGDIKVTVGNVTPVKIKDDSTGVVTTTFTVNAIANEALSTGSITFTVSNPEAVADLSLGDVYFRKRNLYTIGQPAAVLAGFNLPQPKFAVVEYIESYSVSDFFPSESSSIGRAISFIPNASTVKRSGSITFSEPFLDEGTFNGLSSFDLGLANFKDLDYAYGSIKSLISYNERLYFLQESRTGVLAVNRQVIQTGDANNLVSLATNILQSEQYYMGEYGTVSRESVSHKDGKIYFADVNNGKVIRIDSQGLTIISDVNMSSYFDDKFGVISKFLPSKLISGIDDDNDEYIVSSNSITQAQISIDTTPSATTYKAQLDSTGTKVLANFIESPADVFSFNTDERNFNESCDDFDRSLEALVFLDTLQSGGVVFTVNLNDIETATLYGIATDTAYSYFATITFNPIDSTFVFNNSNCTNDNNGTISSDASQLSAFNIAYSVSDRVWSTRYSYTPESIISLHDTLFTFSAGKIFKHDETANRNTYYGGSAAASIVETISNAVPSSIKAFETISLEGDSTWGATISTTNQTSVLADTAYAPDSSDPLGDANSGIWREKEGFYYAHIHGDTVTDGASTISSVTSTSQIFPLGSVAATTSLSTTVSFDAAIDKVPFPLGTTAALYKLDGSNLVKQSVTVASITSEKVLKLSGTASFTDGDVLVVVANSSIEGDQIRDYFAKINLTKTSSDAIELYAINMSFADSKLHY